ncbi:PTS system glucitol/sorbitol-specific transporter subunit IIA [Oceanobacillus picturae]|jgi:glucitol/sorbitol PTS system EIIA component|uniref:PTS system glucitol/sorbitol-specific transporter subunit IIA n=1 Tax=Oceanobacillus picturae TaxID=171693 RepID=W9ALI3_9BACI|nr:PTS glucitol/sorbitol transporter subunit IIA [Oceanobacillus picturae]CDO03531.1 PTS system glucitol/sorbitol-specific transporter subunit IIA [Oceanobacillus picturae]
MEMTKPYVDVNVVQVGQDAELMLEENMIILFNSSVPNDLKEIAVVHDGGSLSIALQAGDEMLIDEEVFKVLFVGDKANETLTELGHATFHFNGESHSDMPGTVCLENKTIPPINENTVISFRR